MTYMHHHRLNYRSGHCLLDRNSCKPKFSPDEAGQAAAERPSQEEVSPWCHPPKQLCRPVVLPISTSLPCRDVVAGVPCHRCRVEGWLDGDRRRLFRNTCSHSQHRCSHSRHRCSHSRLRCSQLRNSPINNNSQPSTNSSSQLRNSLINNNPQPSSQISHCCHSSHLNCHPNCQPSRRLNNKPSSRGRSKCSWDHFLK